MRVKFAESIRLAGCAIVVALSLTGCASGSDDGSSVDPATQTAPTSASVTASISTDDGAASSAAPANEDPARSWVMPDQTGQDLQDSQNAIQKLTDYKIFNTRSEDASGDSRSQIIDHDWKVCSQNIKAGARITEDSEIVFRVVKQDESCP